MATKAMTLVGLDVHARQTHAAILDPASGELRVSRLRLPARGLCRRRRRAGRWLVVPSTKTLGPPITHRETSSPDCDGAGRCAPSTAWANV